MNTKRLVAAFLCLLIPFVTMSVSAKDSGYKVIYDVDNARRHNLHCRTDSPAGSCWGSFDRNGAPALALDSFLPELC
jgi:hypothetical protein